MAKEQDQLKRVELKVSVNCCDGCRKKVLKALNLKGVLRTEVHPTAGRVEVVGDVDAGRLVKRLAKVGKIAEVIVQPPPEGEKTRHAGGSGGGENGKKEVSQGSDKIGGENAGEAPKHGADDKCDKNGDGDAIDKGREEGSGASSPGHGVPQGADVKAATMCYHRAEPAMAVSVHLPYYAANCTMPPPSPSPSPYGFGGCYHGIPPPPSCRRLLPVVRPQPTRFVDEDLFGDDDTAGCHVM